MEVESLAAVIGPIYVIFGLSILLYAKQWQKLLGKWEKDHFLLFPIFLIYLVLGILVVRAYNVWEWNLWLIVTITGWGMLLKGAFYLLAPGSWTKSLLGLKNNAGLFYLGGLIVLAAGAALSYQVYFA